MIYKNVKLLNKDLQLELQDKQGNTIRTIIHFGAYKNKLNEQLFKGKKILECEEVDFDKLAEKYCSPYGDEIKDFNLVIKN